MWRGVVERACLGQCTAMKFSGVDTALYVGVTDSEPPSLYIKSRKLLLLSARLRRRPARGWTVKPPQRRPLIHINIFGIPLLLLNSASYKLSFPLIIRTTFDLSGRPRARHRAALPLAARPIVHHVLTPPRKGSDDEGADSSWSLYKPYFKCQDERESFARACFRAQSESGLRDTLRSLTDPFVHPEQVRFWMTDQDFHSEPYIISDGGDGDFSEPTFGVAVSLPRMLQPEILWSIEPEYIVEYFDRNLISGELAEAMARYVDHKFNESNAEIKGLDVIDWVQQSIHDLRNLTKVFTKDDFQKYIKADGTRPITWNDDRVIIVDHKSKQDGTIQLKLFFDDPPIESDPTYVESEVWRAWRHRRGVPEVESPSEASNGESDEVGADQNELEGGP